MTLMTEKSPVNRTIERGSERSGECRRLPTWKWNFGMIMGRNSDGSKRASEERPVTSSREETEARKASASESMLKTQFVLQ